MASAAFEDIAETFEFLDDWEDRYRHVIELGKAMEPLADAFKVPATKVDGCASQVWILPRIEGQGPGAVFRFQGESDAMIVRGLIAVLHALYDGQSVAEVMAVDAGAECPDDPGTEPCDAERTLQHRGDSRLAVGTRDADQRQACRRVAVYGGGDGTHRGTDGRDDDLGHTEPERTLDEPRHGAGLDGGTREVVSVVARAGDCAEQGSLRDLATVMGHVDELDLDDPRARTSATRFARHEDRVVETLEEAGQARGHRAPRTVVGPQGVREPAGGG